jgi:hypothetical protein
MNLALGGLEKSGGILKVRSHSIDEKIAFASDRGPECVRKSWAGGDLTDQNLKGLRHCESGDENEPWKGMLFKLLSR